MPTPFSIQPFGDAADNEDDEFFPRPEIVGEYEPDDTEEELQVGDTTVTLPPELTDDNVPADVKINEILTTKHIKDLAESEELRYLIQGAMEGTLRTDAPIELPHTQKLNAKAMQVVMLRIAGYNAPEIASITNYHPVYVRIILSHPFAKRILVVAMANAIAHSTVTTRRLQRRVPKMLQVVEQIASNKAVDAPVRLRAAFGWLDRAGVGPTEKREVTSKSEKSVTVTHKRAGLLTQAIREAQGLPSEPVEGDFEVVEESPDTQLELL